MICGKYIVVNPKIMVNIIAINLLFFVKKTDTKCPITAHANDITIIMMELVVVL